MTQNNQAEEAPNAPDPLCNKALGSVNIGDGVVVICREVRGHDGPHIGAVAWLE
jgi:hypothetical protein